MRILRYLSIKVPRVARNSVRLTLIGCSNWLTIKDHRASSDSGGRGSIGFNKDTADARPRLCSCSSNPIPPRWQEQGCLVRRPVGVHCKPMTCLARRFPSV